MQLGVKTIEAAVEVPARMARIADIAVVLPRRHEWTTSRDERESWTDEELLRRLFRHEKMSWDEFIRRFQALIRSTITRVIRPFQAGLSITDPEEIYAQLLYALQARDMHRLRAYTPERGTSLATWIGVVTRNVTLDYLRRLPRRRPTDAFRAHVASTLPTTENPEQVLERKQRAQQALTLLNHLSERDRDFVRMLYVEKLAPEAIAVAFGISINTVYTKKHKIHSRLQQLIAGRTRNSPASGGERSLDAR